MGMRRWGGRALRQKTVSLMFLLSIVPVLGFGTLIYYMGIHIVNSEVNRSSQMSLRQLSEQMDQILLQVEQVSGQLSFQSNLMQIANIRESPLLGSLPTTNDLARDLSAFRGSIEALDSVYFYHFAQNVIVAPEAITTLDDKFADNQWLPAVKQAGREQRQNFWMPPRQMNASSGGKKPVLTYVRLLPLFYEKPQAALLVNVSLNRIRDRIDSFPLGSEGAVLLFNKDGILLTRTDRSPIVANSDVPVLAGLIGGTNSQAAASTVSIGSGDMYVTTVASPKSGLICMMVIPTDASIQNVRLLQKLIVTLTAALCLLALLSAYFSYSRFQKGVRRIFQSLFKGEQGTSAPPTTLNFHYEDNVLTIENHISYLLKEMGDIRERWQEQLPLLRDHFLVSALLGNAELMAHYEGRPEAGSALFKLPLFAVFLVQMDAVKKSDRFSEKDEDLFLFAAANIGRDVLASATAVETIRVHRQTAFVLNLPGETQETDLIRLAENVRQSVKQYLKQTVTVSVGKMTNSFEDIGHSYQEALRLLQSNWVRSSDEVISSRFHGNAFTQVAIHYPYKFEKTIIDCVAMGDGDGAVAALGQFAETLDRYEETPFQFIKTFYLQLFISLLREFQDHPTQLEQALGDGNRYAELLHLDDRDAVVEWLSRRLIHPFIALIKQERTLRTKSLVERMIQLIEERYAQDLSLVLAAELLGTSPSNLSQLFKEQMGETFISYVTAFRVEKTKRLLENTELGIADIAKEVGYGNAQQLIRVFKKLEGRTPGDYRNACRMRDCPEYVLGKPDL